MTEFVGSVYKVPDSMWGFQAVGRVEHPGACTLCGTEHRYAILLKGTDAEGCPHRFPRVVTVLASRANGLIKTTAFTIEPRKFRLRKIELLHENRLVGRLDRHDLSLLQAELHRVFPLT